MQDPDKISLNFILSTGRTGSTLLSSMLNMHPEAMSTWEEPFAYNLYPKYKSIAHWNEDTIREFCRDFFMFSEGKLEPQFGSHEDLLNLLREHLPVLTGETAIKLAYLAFFPHKDKSGVRTLVDKQVKFHYILDEVAAFYPECKFIVLLRDPRDNVLVKYKRSHKLQKKRSIYFFSKIWNSEYHTINKKISKLSDNRYIYVKYEDLVENPRKVLERIAAFLNITYNDAMLRYDETFKEDISGNKSAISDTVKQNLLLFQGGLSEKVNTKKVGIWKKELKEREFNTVWGICGNTARSIGYHAEGCLPVSIFSSHMIKDVFRFYIQKIILPSLYYSLPYSIKYTVKKIKYGKSLKKSKWASVDYLQKNLTEATKK